MYFSLDKCSGHLKTLVIGCVNKITFGFAMYEVQTHKDWNALDVKKINSTVPFYLV